jgi:hypothetical protein
MLNLGFRCLVLLSGLVGEANLRDLWKLEEGSEAGEFGRHSLWRARKRDRKCEYVGSICMNDRFPYKPVPTKKHGAV